MTLAQRLAAITTGIHTAATKVAAVASKVWGASQFVLHLALKATSVSVSSLITSIKSLSISQKLAAVASGIHTAAMKAAAVAARAWSVVQVALNAILTANPIGLVVVAIAALVAGLVLAYNKSESFRNICDRLWTATKELATAVWDFLVKAFERASEVIKKAWEWIKTFFGIEDESSAESVADALDNQAESTERLADANEDAAASGLKVKEAVDWQKMSYEQLGKAIESQKTKVAQLAGTGAANAKKEADRLKKMEARYKSLGKTFGLSDSGQSNEYDGKNLIANAKSYKELGNNITYYQNALEKTDPAEKEKIENLSRTINLLVRSQEEIKRMQEAYSRPEALDSLSDINAEIAYQKGLRENARKSEIAGIDKEIERLESLKRSMERSSHVPLADDEIKTYRQLENEISFYEGLLDDASAKERVQIRERINSLNKLKKEWDGILELLDAPGPVDQLDTIGELEQAVSYYDAMIKKASADEITALVASKAAVEEKMSAMQRLADIASLSIKTAHMDGLSGKRLNMELKLIGLDGVREQIRSLQDMLDDTRNPLGASEREKVQGMIDVWKRYEVQLRKNSLSFVDAWSNVKGIGNTFLSLTDTMKGNGNAWEKTTAAIDGAIALYNAFVNIGGMVKTICDAIGISKTTEAAATASAAAATAAGGTVSVATASEEAAASAIVTTAKIEEAAAKTMAAHASVPWVGIAIAGGMIAAMTGIMLSLPKFANGGIAYGPTLGIFGEYAGAANNPEVVAPLSKLKDLLHTSDNTAGGRVRFEIEGRKLVGMIEKELNIKLRS